jgi:hypothetical protein
MLPKVTDEVASMIRLQLIKDEEYGEILMKTLKEEQPVIYEGVSLIAKEVLQRDDSEFAANNIMWAAVCVYQSLKAQHESNELKEMFE